MTLMQTREAADRETWVHGTEDEAAVRPITPRGILRAARDSGGLAFSIPPVVFVLIPIASAWMDGPRPTALLVTAMLLMYGVLFVATCGIGLYPLRVRVLWFALCTALLLATIPLLGANLLFMVMFQAMTHVLLLPWRWAVPSMLLMSLSVVVLAVVLRVPIAAGLAVMGTVMAWGIGYGVRQQILQEQLEAAQQRNAVLAVAAERERIGRDLHDLVGHSLTSLTISTSSPAACWTPIPRPPAPSSSTSRPRCARRSPTSAPPPAACSTCAPPPRSPPPAPCWPPSASRPRSPPRCLR